MPFFSAASISSRLPSDVDRLTLTVMGALVVTPPEPLRAAVAVKVSPCARADGTAKIRAARANPQIRIAR